MNGSGPLRPSPQEREPEQRVEIRRVEVESPKVEERETRIEVQREQEQASEGREVREAPSVLPPATPPSARPSPPAAPPKSPELVAVETILSENLQEIYQRLSPAEQAAFREQGEATASKVVDLLRAATVKVKEVLALIRNWLKSLPGVNAFFLEQEAKIKTDKLLALRDRR